MLPSLDVLARMRKAVSPEELQAAFARRWVGGTRGDLAHTIALVFV